MLIVEGSLVGVCNDSPALTGVDYCQQLGFAQTVWQQLGFVTQKQTHAYLLVAAASEQYKCYIALEKNTTNIVIFYLVNCIAIIYVDRRRSSASMTCASSISFFNFPSHRRER